MEKHREFDQLFVVLTVLYCVAICVAIATAKKLVLLPFGANAAAGTILGYSFCFIITDIISELYGNKASRFVLRCGLMTFAVVVSLFHIALYLPAGAEWGAHDSYAQVFELPLKFIAGGLLAYWLSQQVDVFVYHKVKHWTSGKHLWLRNNISTLLGQLVDSCVWPTIVLAGVLSWTEIVAVIQGEYMVKASVALLDTIIIYAVIKGLLKR